MPLYLKALFDFPILETSSVGLIPLTPIGGLFHSCERDLPATQFLECFGLFSLVSLAGHVVLHHLQVTITINASNTT